MDAVPIHPYFFPKGNDWEKFPPGSRQILETVVVPAFAEFVLESDNALERAAGISLAFALYQEVLGQFSLTSSQVPGGPPPSLEDHRALERHLRLLGAKHKWASFLARLRQARNSKERDQAN